MARKKSTTKSGALDFALEKLASSGLTEQDGLALGMSVVTASDLDPKFHPIRGLHLPYHDLDGSDTGFYRLRYLEELPGFAGSVAKPQRYVQPAGTLNRVYLPRLNGINWVEVAKHPDIPLIITEGELKAACACANDYLTIALGGVDVWCSSKRQVALLPPLDQFIWKERTVYIVFDSDAATNPDVAAATLRLSNMLFRQGAMCRVVTLPGGVKGKQGLDDFIVAGGELGPLLDEASQTPLATALVEINQQYAYVKDQDVVVELASARRTKREGFTNGLMANRRLVEYRLGKNSAMVRTEISVPSEWLRWPCRRDVNSLVYVPGAPRVVDDNYNLWKSWGVVPSAGDVAPWNALLDFLFDGLPEERHWFERWLAYPLQHPGAKLYAAAVLWGPETGTGKSLVGYTMGRIYGDNFAEIGNAELHNNFNEWAVGKQFILGDEITGNDRRNEADRLKQLITQQKLRINMKHLPTYEVQDCLNYYFTSNHPDAFFIDDQDRRYFVHRVPNKRREREFYRNYVKWLGGEGASALFHHLLTLPLGDFDPAAPAMVTESRSEMVDHARSDLAAFVANLLRNKEDELERLAELYHLTAVPDLVLNRHLRSLYDPDGTARVTANGLGRELSRAGIKTLAPVNTDVFGVQRFYVVQNEEKWLAAGSKEVREYVDDIYKLLDKKRSKK